MKKKKNNIIQKAFIKLSRNKYFKEPVLMDNVLYNVEELKSYVLSDIQFLNSILDTLLARDSFWVELMERTPLTDLGTKNLKFREEWLEKTLAAIPAGKKILDAGAGELQYKRFCSHLDYVSQDFAQYNGEGDNLGIQTGTWDNSKLDIVSDIIDMPVEDKSFDAVMCIEVFEHIPQPALAMKEFARILKPGGKLIVTAPFASITHFAPYFFANGYSNYWYERMCEDFGFKAIEFTSNGNYFEFLAQEIRRIEYVADKYSQTKLTRKDEALIKMMLDRLSKFNSKEADSDTLACVGYQVLAEKI